VILVDANLLLYAEDSLSEHHEAARDWWDAQLSESSPVCLCWPVLVAFIRIGTNARLHQRPLTLKEGCERIQSWFAQPACA
jgi:predicted nucleic acid-binding protein